jgi:two-component system, sensor histidine kinase and response regulator
MTKFEITPELTGKPIILIVDDNSENLLTLSSFFQDDSYIIKTALNGKNALDMINNDRIKPDLILLDIMMPDISGYEVCRILKEKEDIRNIPVIFITGIKERDEIVKVYQLGASDYITKPFKKEEVIARTSTHIRFKKAHDFLNKQNEKFSNLFNEKSNFITLASNDLNNPLNGIAGISELIISDADYMPRQEISSLSKTINKSTNSLIQIVSDYLNLSIIEEGEIVLNPEYFNINKLILDVIDSFNKSIDNKKITLNFVNGKEEIIVFADINKLSQIIDNLISNAIKYSPINGTIRISSNNEHINEESRKYCIVEIRDVGNGITKEEFHKLFTKFGKLSSKPTDNEPSTGIGLYLAKKLADAMNCYLSCESKAGEGTNFILKVPVNS